ncbi:uncharacterized protein LOC142488194 [Ascaphus truei]|uniref:uncharacterized protein LOC142488194 n=1 Tax=Ascaphus truei TaxID=8439 RepID=UPI003F5AC7D5
MPFGLCNALAVFQDFVNEDLLNQHVVVYLDDILIFNKSLHRHSGHVKQVLQCLRKNHLFAKLEKCQFHQTTTAFLGYIISNTGLAMDPAMVKAALDWPCPTTLKAVQLFLGFSNYYRRFIQNFSSVVAPITALTQKRSDPASWSAAATKAFNSLKTAYVSTPILRPRSKLDLHIRSGRFRHQGQSYLVTEEDPSSQTAPMHVLL